jgi:hypothetical protein
VAEVQMAFWVLEPLASVVVLPQADVWAQTKPQALAPAQANPRPQALAQPKV